MTARVCRRAMCAFFVGVIVWMRMYGCLYAYFHLEFLVIDGTTILEEIVCEL